MVTTKRATVCAALTLTALISLSACGSNSDSAASSDGGFSADKAIGVITREEGSGTRGAFVELFKIETKENGKKVDHTLDSAVTTNNTSVMLTTVQHDLYSIGYSSLGALNDTVKAVAIDGVKPSVENIQNKTYKIARPFNVVLPTKVSDLAKDFLSFIMSKEGQEVISKNGYVPITNNAPAYQDKKLSGKLTISGSSSVTPVMEKLKEAFAKINPNINIEVQQSDSSTGVANAIDGVTDLGMASRELHDSEKAKGVTAEVIARDGIAVVVNPKNPINDLGVSQVTDIFTGKITTWNEVLKK